MKLLVFSDIHSNLKTVEKIKKLALKVDILVCAGDISEFGMGLENVLKELFSIGKPMVIIHGNHEDANEIRRLCGSRKNVYFIHKKGFIKDDYVFYGYGGGGFSFIDINLDKLIIKVKELYKNKKIVFVTHAPPYNTKTDRLLVGHQGSNSVRKFIQHVQPILHIHGHFHETEKKTDNIGVTKIVNASVNPKIVNI